MPLLRKATKNIIHF
jgi:hypothetical protein